MVVSQIENSCRILLFSRSLSCFSFSHLSHSIHPLAHSYSLSLFLPHSLSLPHHYTHPLSITFSLLLPFSLPPPSLTLTLSFYLKHTRKHYLSLSLSLIFTFLPEVVTVFVLSWCYHRSLIFLEFLKFEFCSSEKLQSSQTMETLVYTLRDSSVGNLRWFTHVFKSHYSLIRRN